MKWFKHQSDAHMNAKLQKLLIKYGAQGYGLYWFCLECVAGNISDHKLTFELEHDAEILAHHLKLDSRQVEDIMNYMISLRLFENRDGTITCLKLAKRLDQSMTSSPAMRKLISGMKSHDKVMINHDVVKKTHARLDKTRQDKTINSAKKRSTKKFLPPTVAQVQAYLDEKGYSDINAGKFVAHYETSGWMRGKTKIIDWKACVKTWRSNGKDTQKPRNDFSLGAI